MCKINISPIVVYLVMKETLCTKSLKEGNVCLIQIRKVMTRGSNPTLTLANLRTRK